MSKIKTRKKAEEILDEIEQTIKMIEEELDEGNIDTREQFDTLCTAAARCAVAKAYVTSMEVMR